MSTAVGLIRIGLRADTQPLQQGLDRGGKSVLGFAGKVEGLSAGGLVKLVAGTAAAAAAVGALTRALSDATSKAIEMDSAVNLMARTTGLEGPELAALKGEIEAMATSADLAGMSIAQLTDIGIMGGRMGVDREKLPGFIKDVARVGIALDDVPVEEAAQSIVQILGVFGLGVEHATSFASALNKVSNNAKTTGGAILDVAGRMKGGAATLGLSPQKTLALATAMSDVGISVEVAGTAMSQVLAKMAKDTASFARIAGVSFEEFKAALVRDPLEALKLFVAGLEGGTGDFSLLEEVGITGARESGVILQLSKAMANLDEFVRLSESDWESHASILRDNEFATRRLASRQQHLRERIDLVGRRAGEHLAPALGEARAAWVEFVEENADGLIASAETLGWAIGELAPVGKAVARVLGGAFGALQATVTGLSGAFIQFLGGLAKAANHIPGVNLDFADSLADFGLAMQDSADERLAGALDRIFAAGDGPAEALDAVAESAGSVAEAVAEAATAMADLGDPEVARKVEELTARLKDQVETFGLSSTEADLYRLRREGATADQLAEAAALAAKVEAMEAEGQAREDLAKKAEQVLDATRAPLERFEAEAAELRELLAEGLIDPETFKRAIEEAGSGLAAEDEANSAALELGSREARSAILRAAGAGGADGMKAVEQVNRDQLDEQREANRHLRRLAGTGGVEAFDL